jgi:hypothetical protein
VGQVARMGVTGNAYTLLVDGYERRTVKDPRADGRKILKWIVCVIGRRVLDYSTSG